MRLASLTAPADGSAFFAPASPARARARSTTFGSSASAALRNNLADAEAFSTAADQERFAGLLTGIRTPRDVPLAYPETADRHWTVTICTADFLGALSLIVGLLTAYRLDVLKAD